MIPVFPDIEWTRPDFFWLAAALPLFWLWWRTGSRLVILIRSLIVVLLIASLAQPLRVEEAIERSEPPSRIFAFDLSRSVQPATRRWMLETARRIAATPGRDRFFVFGGRPQEVQDWEERLQGAEADPSVEPGKTNLAALFTQALGEPGVAGSVYLFTDGWETEGRVRERLPSLGGSSVRIVPLVPPGGQEVANVVVEKILAPHEAESRAGIRLKVRVHNLNRSPVRGKMVWTRDERPWKTDAVVIEPGHQLLAYEALLPDRGLVAYEARFVPDDPGQDAFDLDNHATAWVGVKAREGVLIVNGGEDQGRYLEAILERQGFKVTAVGPGKTPPPPEKFATVIFNNVPRRRVAQSYMEQIRRYVAGGGSFVMLGANGSFGPGGYRNTPIAEVLPVELEEPRKKEKKTRGIVLIIDKSASMRTDLKLAYAKEAAQALARNLKNSDLFGVVGFDITPFEVLPLQSMASQRSAVARQVARLKPGGKTYLYPALLLAKRMLERSQANFRHVIVLSDGETGGSSGDYMDLVSVMKQDLKISVSAIAIGDKANVSLLRRLSVYGGGAFHHTYDPSTLPRIVAGEVRDDPEETPAEKEFRPRLTRQTNIFTDFPDRRLPPVTGFVETETRSRATTDVLLQRRDGSRKPLVASWSYGKGKAAVFAADLQGGWTRSWIRWQGLDPFWNRVLKWLSPGKDPLPVHEVRINAAGNGTVMDLYVYGPEAPGTFRYSVRGESGEHAGKFRQQAPGHYRADLPTAAPGSYRIEVIESLGGRERVYPPIGYTQAHDPGAEIPRDRFNVDLLEALARATGGELNARIAAPPPAEIRIRSAVPLQMYPILAAGLLLLLEVFVRRWGTG